MGGVVVAPEQPAPGPDPAELGQGRVRGPQLEPARHRQAQEVPEGGVDDPTVAHEHDRGVGRRPGPVLRNPVLRTAVLRNPVLPTPGLPTPGLRSRSVIDPGSSTPASSTPASAAPAGTPRMRCSAPDSPGAGSRPWSRRPGRSRRGGRPPSPAARTARRSARTTCRRGRARGRAHRAVVDRDGQPEGRRDDLGRLDGPRVVAGDERRGRELARAAQPGRQRVGLLAAERGEAAAGAEPADHPRHGGCRTRRGGSGPAGSSPAWQTATAARGRPH